jgi:hypothetical protein
MIVSAFSTSDFVNLRTYLQDMLLGSRRVFAWQFCEDTGFQPILGPVITRDWKPTRISFYIDNNDKVERFSIG